MHCSCRARTLAIVHGGQAGLERPGPGDEGARHEGAGEAPARHEVEAALPGGAADAAGAHRAEEHVAVEVQRLIQLRGRSRGTGHTVGLRRRRASRHQVTLQLSQRESAATDALAVCSATVSSVARHAARWVCFLWRQPVASPSARRRASRRSNWSGSAPTVSRRHPTGSSTLNVRAAPRRARWPASAACPARRWQRSTA